MSTPRISVLLPCRNAAPYLRECIASLQQQSWADFEVVAVDDHSTDDTRIILDQWATDDPRVRITPTRGAGLVDALNTGITCARGELIARMDADDVAVPTRFEKQLKAFDADADLAACGTQVRYFPRSDLRDGALRYEAWLNSLTEPADLARDVFVECPIAHPTLMVRTHVLREVGAYVERGWPEDYDLVLRLFLAGKRMRNLAVPLLHWRDRAERLSRVDARYSEDAFRRAKVHYLKEWRPDMVGIVVWGAGPVGKAFARELIVQGIRVTAFVDVDARKIGQTIHGAPVVPPAALPAARAGAFVLAAVSGDGPRSEIRAGLEAMQLKELTDFVAVA